MEFSNDMGADILIRTWRLLIGGHIIEEIDHPNVLLKVIKYDYGQDLGMNEICEVLDKSGKGTGYQGLNKITKVDVGADNPCAVVKCVLDLNFSGIFGSTQTFPVGMTGDVEIEITLEDPRKCLQVVQSGYKPFALTTTANSSNGIPVANITAGSSAGTGYTGKATPESEVAPLRASLSSTYITDSPFSVGQGVNLVGEGTTGQATGALVQLSTADVTDIVDDGGNTKVVATTAGLTTNPGIDLRIGFNPAGVEFDGATSWDNNGTLTYEVSVPTLCLQVVVPPDQYVQEQARKVATEGYSIDVPTYTCYKNNTYDNVYHQQL